MFNSARCCLMLVALCLACAAAPWAPPEAGAAQPASKAAPSDATAQYELGLRHAKGIDIPQNLATARAWFEQAASQGYAEAQFRLGQFYEQGLGGPQDYASARHWYEQAANQGHAAAQ